jgi:hypothetical protein
MPNTYEQIASISMGGTNNATFSSIPATYTDLKIVFMMKHVNQGTVRMSFNGDIGSPYNYSNVNLRGNEGTVASARETAESGMVINLQQNLSDTYFCLGILDIMSYTESINKTALWSVSGSYPGGRHEVCTGVGMWNNTSTITSVTLSVTNQPIDSGSYATLYGIKRA